MHEAVPGATDRAAIHALGAALCSFLQAHACATAVLGDELDPGPLEGFGNGSNRFFSDIDGPSGFCPF
jgi:hypothetical protein